MLSLWSNTLYLRTPEPRNATTTKRLTDSTTELPCRHSCASYYTTTKPYQNNHQRTFILYLLHQHLRQPQPTIALIPDLPPPSSNNETVNHKWWLRWTHHIIILDQWYPPSLLNHVLLPSIANAKIAKMKTTTLSTTAISNTTEILKMSISLSFSVRMDFVCRREAMLQPCIRPYLFQLYPFIFSLSLFVLITIIKPSFVITCFSYSHVNDFTCLWFHMLSVITCYPISHVYYYLLCMMYL